MAPSMLRHRSTDRAGERRLDRGGSGDVAGHAGLRARANSRSTLGSRPVLPVAEAGHPAGPRPARVATSRSATAGGLVARRSGVHDGADGQHRGVDGGAVELAERQEACGCASLEGRTTGDRAVRAARTDGAPAPWSMLATITASIRRAVGGSGSSPV